MTDIVEQLRHHANWCHKATGGRVREMLYTKAANEIERLRVKADTLQFLLNQRDIDIGGLKRRLAEAERDAARYRFIKNCCEVTCLGVEIESDAHIDQYLDDWPHEPSDSADDGYCESCDGDRCTAGPLCVATSHRAPPLQVQCARCGIDGTSETFLVEEGDEWECPACWERCEAQERDTETVPPASAEAAPGKRQ